MIRASSFGIAPWSLQDDRRFTAHQDVSRRNVGLLVPAPCRPSTVQELLPQHLGGAVEGSPAHGRRLGRHQDQADAQTDLERGPAGERVGGEGPCSPWCVVWCVNEWVGRCGCGLACMCVLACVYTGCKNEVHRPLWNEGQLRRVFACEDKCEERKGLWWLWYEMNKDNGQSVCIIFF